MIDTGFGKRSCFVDLESSEGRERLWELIREADVVVQAYRPGSLAARGFDPKSIAEARPGIVVVGISAYGRRGPWAERRGFDSLVQCSAGIADEGARAVGSDRPVPLPCQALDHGTGYLAAFGAMAALLRRSAEGGSWQVTLSLAQTAHWLDGLGRVEGGPEVPDTDRADVLDLLDIDETPFGSVSHVRPVEQLPETPARWERPPGAAGLEPRALGWLAASPPRSRRRGTCRRAPAAGSASAGRARPPEGRRPSPARERRPRSRGTRR